jgi:hypothetical protein
VEASLREAQRRRRNRLCRCVLVVVKLRSSPKGVGGSASLEDETRNHAPPDVAVGVSERMS